MTEQAYPLAWPEGWKRTSPGNRKRAKFSKGVTQYRHDGSSYISQGDITINNAVERVLAEIGRLGASRNLVISTNLRIRNDGLPLSKQRMPEDPGVAIYWQDGQERRCMAIDIYDRVEHNLAAVAATIEAMRAIERHGGAEILNRAFTGFVALEHNPQTTRAWYDVLEVRVDASREVIEANYKRLRSDKHPDKGGTAEEFNEVQNAYNIGIGGGHGNK